MMVVWWCSQYRCVHFNFKIRKGRRYWKGSQEDATKRFVAAVSRLICRAVSSWQGTYGSVLLLPAPFLSSIQYYLKIGIWERERKRLCYSIHQFGQWTRSLQSGNCNGVEQCCCTSWRWRQTEWVHQQNEWPPTKEGSKMETCSECSMFPRPNLTFVKTSF